MKMNPISTLTIENFQHGSWNIFRDSSNQVVPISSGSGFEGYLVYNHNTNQYAQVRFANIDTNDQKALSELLQYCKKSEFELLPEILQVGL